MIYRMYSVRDNAVGSFGRPMFMRSDGEMTRSFMDEVNRDDSPIGAHPEDYALFYVGEFDEMTGKVVSPTEPHSMGLAVSYVKAPGRLEAVK